MAESYARAHAPAHNAHAHAPEAVGERGGWPLWRYRKQLAPFVIAFGLLGISTWGYLEVRTWDWFPLLGVLVVVGFTWKMDRLVERVYAGSVGMAAVLWTQASWALGIDQPGVLLALVGILVPSATIWIHHQQPRGRIQIVGGSLWPWRWQRWQFRCQMKRELRAAFIEWVAGAQRARVPGSSVRKAVADYDKGVCRLHVDLANGQILSDLDLRRAGSLIRAARSSVRVLDDYREHQVIVEWDHEWAPSEHETAIRRRLG